MSVTGPPPEMAECREDLTPMMSQYFDLCEAYDDALVLFQVGDFYEAFCDAAAEVSRVCEVTLTQREDSTGTYRMAGIPIDNAATYVDSLLGAGHRVAVADQIQDPDEASGVVDRAVTRVVTPGTVTDDELLEAGTANYVACVAAGPGADDLPFDAGDGDDLDSVPDDLILDSVPDDSDLDPGAYAVAFVDVTTGEFLVADADRPATVVDELERFAPAEVVLDPALGAESHAPETEGKRRNDTGTEDPGRADGDPVPGGTDDGDPAPGGTDDRASGAGIAGTGLDVEFDPTVTVGAHDPDAFDPKRAAAAIDGHVGRPGKLVETVAGLRACGALLSYAEYTQGGADGELGHVSRLRCYEPDEYVHLNATALRSLEVFESRSQGDGPTVRAVLDRTSSALGRRRLTAWLRQPLVERAAIERRHGAVADLVEDSLARADLREALAEVYDLERLITRVTRGRADARDLRSLKSTLDVVPGIRETLAELGADRLADLHGAMDDLADVRALIDRAIRPDPPAEITEGGVIQEGFDDELDELRATERAGREWVADLEQQERERTGIDSLAVGYNDVHGYYIEVTDPNLDRVPDDYTRRQTLKNSERFYTPELKRREDEILGAAERADAREHRLFREVREQVAAEADRVETLADALATVDALAALAAVAVERDYVRPEMGADGIAIEGGRHPVVETTEETFVPNDADLADQQFAVITGPNMSGKSTYMRQVALVSLLAQAGGFVPADRARLPVVDGIYTRVGASDDIAGGQSTFMREMAELTEILHSATERSLVLLDEVGRGTSTVDGLSIAWAVTEYLHDRVGATTLFATHYHELTAIAGDLPAVRLLHFGAERTDGDVTFRYDVREGAASSSYGVEIARMAGVPDPVVERSRSLVAAGGPASVDADLGSDPGNGNGNDLREHPSVSPPADDVSTPDDRGSAPSSGEDSTPVHDEGVASGADEGNPVREETDGSTAATDRPAIGRAERADADVDADLAAALLDVDVATMTPLEALNVLADLRSRAETYARDRTEP